MSIKTDLTSISTHGWYTEPNLSSNLTPISTYGWYYDEIPLNIISVFLSLPIETISRLSLDFNKPVETISNINFLNNIPIETISSIEFLNNNIPVEWLKNVDFDLFGLNTPVEYQKGITAFNNQGLPIEILGTVFDLGIGNFPIESITEVNFGALGSNLPIEYQGGITAFTRENIPIEILGSIADLGIDGNIPIDITGQTIFWVLDRRGVLWILGERGDSC